jgi:cyclophilin family peptidyl-prolyl cis-trans isomerase
MKFPKLAWRNAVSGSSQRNAGRTPAASMVETLEGRVLLSAAPRITSSIADNRGAVEITLDAKLDKTTVNTSTVLVKVAGADGVVGTADDLTRASTVSYDRANNKIYVNAHLRADRPYMVMLRGNVMRTLGGVALDGEFNGNTATSGNGIAGGTYRAKVLPRNVQTARFTTSLGNIDVQLYGSQTPLTVANFLHYANSGAWDGTFFHRSVPNFVIQGGGFRITDNAVDNVATDVPAVVNEPGISNLRGTIAMAKLGNDPNSATNQWFFNLSDTNADGPADLDHQNGGFTVFGAVTAGMNVVDGIAALPTTDASGLNSALTNLPTLTAISSTTPLTAGDLVYVYRIAIKMRLAAV